MQSDNGWSTVASCSQIPWQIQVCLNQTFKCQNWIKILNCSIKQAVRRGNPMPHYGLVQVYWQHWNSWFAQKDVSPTFYGSWGVTNDYWSTYTTFLLKVDLKILYYELIRMLVNYEREQSRDQELYEYTRSITKIEGYQVSNKILFCIS